MSSFEVRIGRGRRLGTLVLRVTVSAALLVLIAVLGTLAFEPDKLSDRIPIAGGLVLLAAITHVVLFLSEDQRLLVVEPAGIRYARTEVPWPSIAQVVLVSAARGDEIGIRLRMGAPLPAGVTAVVFNPRTPRALHNRHTIPAHRLDVDRFASAVRDFAPRGVELVSEEVPAPLPPPSGRSPDRRGTGDVIGVVADVRLRDHNWSRRRHTYKPHPVVAFPLPDGRHIIAESQNPGPGRPGDRIRVGYDLEEPTDVRVFGRPPGPIRPLFRIPHTPYRGRVLR